jgi:hypothetical protein
MLPTDYVGNEGLEASGVSGNYSYIFKTSSDFELRGCSVLGLGLYASKGSGVGVSSSRSTTMQGELVLKDDLVLLALLPVS